MKKILLGAALLSTFALLLSGCGSAKVAAPTVSATPSPSATNPYGAAPIDPPGPNDTVLTLTKGTTSVNLTMGQLQAMASSTIEIYEPFVKQNQSFLAIPLLELFDQVNITATDSVITKALNDYAYTNTAKKFIDARGMLAIKRNGKAIPFDQGGPIRIIYPTGSVWSDFLDPWNWSLNSITVK